MDRERWNKGCDNTSPSTEELVAWHGNHPVNNTDPALPINQRAVIGHLQFHIDTARESLEAIVRATSPDGMLSVLTEDQCRTLARKMAELPTPHEIATAFLRLNEGGQS